MRYVAPLCNDICSNKVICSHIVQPVVNSVRGKKSNIVDLSLAVAKVMVLQSCQAQSKPTLHEAPRAAVALAPHK